MDPPTTVICLEHGINCVFLMFSVDKCDVPVRQMLAPLSGIALQIVGGDFCRQGNEGDIDHLVINGLDNADCVVS